MKQIVDKLNKIAKKINENVELSDRDLIIDSLDSITKAYGGTPNDSNLIVDKLEDIYNNIGPAVSGNIEITENGENINVAPYATATVNVAGSGGGLPTCEITLVPMDSETGIGFAQGGSYEVTENSLIPLTGGVYETTTKNTPYVNYGGDYVACMFFDAGTTLTPTNEVNCQWDDVNGGVLITDETLPSSITLTGKTPK